MTFFKETLFHNGETFLFQSMLLLKLNFSFIKKLFFLKKSSF